jgi:putative oxidoreductase
MPSNSRTDPGNTVFRSRVRRRVAGSSEADIIAAVRGEFCEVRDARKEKVVTMTMSDMESETRPSLMARVRQLYDRLGQLPLSVIQLMARIGMAMIFWRSGQSKLANWDLTLQLFANEYKVPVIPPEIAAPMAVAVELGAPALLVLGLCTRIATLPMIGMTLVIQVFVYPQAWVDHLVWMTLLLLLLSRGPGVFSLDHLIAKALRQDHAAR